MFSVIKQWNEKHGLDKSCALSFLFFLCLSLNSTKTHSERSYKLLKTKFIKKTVLNDETWADYYCLIDALFSHSTILLSLLKYFSFRLLILMQFWAAMFVRWRSRCVSSSISITSMKESSPTCFLAPHYVKRLYLLPRHLIGFLWPW